MVDFIIDVENYYSYTSSYLDDDYNIVIIGNNYQLVVPRTDIKPYYEGYLKSAVPRKTMVARAAGYLTNLVKDYEKSHRIK